MLRRHCAMAERRIGGRAGSFSPNRLKHDGHRPRRQCQRPKLTLDIARLLGARVFILIDPTLQQDRTRRSTAHSHQIIAGELKCNLVARHTQLFGQQHHSRSTALSDATARKKDHRAHLDLVLDGIGYLDRSGGKYRRGFGPSRWNRHRSLQHLRVSRGHLRSRGFRRCSRAIGRRQRRQARWSRRNSPFTFLTPRGTKQGKRSQSSTRFQHSATLPPVENRIHHARLRSKKPLANQTVEYIFSHSEPELPFRPGQFLSLRVGTDDLDNPILRSYSIASSPDQRGEIRLVLRILEDGIGSRFFAALSPGDEVTFTGPMGFFVNELSHPGDVVYVATGTGIAPILPMIQETLSRAETGRVELFWGLRHEDDLFWQDELSSLSSKNGRFRAHVFLSQPRGFWRERGRIVGPVVELVPSLQRPIFYLCGNGQMIEECKAALIARGVERKKQIRTEAFFD